MSFFSKTVNFVIHNLLESFVIAREYRNWSTVVDSNFEPFLYIGITLLVFKTEKKASHENVCRNFQIVLPNKQNGYSNISTQNNEEIESHKNQKTYYT